MSVLRKLNIDDLVVLLAQMRKQTEFVDMQILEGNILQVRPTKENKRDTDDPPEDLNNINQIIG